MGIHGIILVTFLYPVIQSLEKQNIGDEKCGEFFPPPYIHALCHMTLEYFL